MEAAGLIERAPHPEHGRVLRAYLTETGERLISGAHEQVEAVEERMLAALNRDERTALLDALRRCADSLGTASKP